MTKLQSRVIHAADRMVNRRGWIIDDLSMSAKEYLKRRGQFEQAVAEYRSAALAAQRSRKKRRIK